MKSFILKQIAFMPTTGEIVHICLIFKGRDDTELKSQISFKLGDPLGDIVQRLKNAATQIKHNAYAKTDLDKITWKFIETELPQSALKVWVRIKEEPGYAFAIHIKDGKFVSVKTEQQISANQWLEFYEGVQFGFSTGGAG